MATRKKSGSGGGFRTFLFGFLFAVLLAAAGGWAYLHWGAGPSGLHWGAGPSGRVPPAPGRLGPVRHAPARQSAASQAPAEGSPASEAPANVGAAMEAPPNPSAAPAPEANPASPTGPPQAGPGSVSGHPIPRPPFDVSEDVFEAGAHVYQKQCASCHGLPGHDAATAQRTDPPASQLWKKAAVGTVTGVSDHPPGETFLQVKQGVRHSGMPSYQHLLSDNQIWDVSLLLQNAGQQLPDPVVSILRHP